MQLLAGLQDPTAGLPGPLGPLGPLAPGSSAATAAAAAAMLAGSADIASRLLSCYGNLFTASLDQGGSAEWQDWHAQAQVQGRVAYGSTGDAVGAPASGSLPHWPACSIVPILYTCMLTSR